MSLVIELLVIPVLSVVVNVTADLSTCLVDTVSELLAGVLVAAAIQSLASILFTEKNFMHRLTIIFLLTNLDFSFLTMLLFTPIV